MPMARTSRSSLSRRGGSDPTAETPRTLAAARQCLPPDCRANPAWKGLLFFLRDLAIYGIGVAGLASTDSLPLLAALWLLTSLAIAGLFVIAHDAAHGALFRSNRLSYVVGQLAMLPSLHAYSVWVAGHNRVHHPFAGCEGWDFVWHPSTREQYRELSPPAKLRHRFEWSALGAGAYYIRAVWWARIMRLRASDKARRQFRRDRSLVYAYLAGATAALLIIGDLRYGHMSGGVWSWFKIFGVPWVLWNYFIGWAVYVQHIAPDIRWRSRRSWTRFGGQIECTTMYDVPRWLNFFWHNILLHVPHHVDPRIPFYALPRGAEALLREFPDVVRLRPVSWPDYVRTTRRCKLYDFDRQIWMTYAEAGM